MKATQSSPNPPEVYLYAREHTSVAAVVEAALEASKDHQALAVILLDGTSMGEGIRADLSECCDSEDGGVYRGEDCWSCVWRVRVT